MSGVILAAPSSASGKTVVTLGLLRRLCRQGLRVAAAKAGPDYIDPGFLAAASGGACANLDPWAMRRATLAAEIGALDENADLVLCEGVMGLFDGAGTSGAGSTASLAALTGWPVVLVVDASGQGASVAALVEGFVRHRPDIEIAGIVFNRVAGARHRAILEESVRRALPALRLLGAVPRSPDLAVPSRHLGLVQAGERDDLEAFLDRAAREVGDAIDVDALISLARPSVLTGSSLARLPPLGTRIAVARDRAFAFAYESVLAGWRHEGAALTFFSPLGNEAPAPESDAVYLPGGYPELFAGTLAANRRFLDGVRGAAARGAAIYGECGGYMVLGQSIVDAEGAAHAMAGLLPLAASFADKRLHLGYRTAALASDGILGRCGEAFRGHEFHYARIVEEGAGAPLFKAADSDGADLGLAGRAIGRVAGSFVHLIDRA